MALQLLVLSAWVMLPGAGVAIVLGLKRPWWALLAPATSIGLLSGFAIILGLLGIPWHGGTVAAAIILLIAIIAAGRVFHHNFIPGNYAMRHGKNNYATNYLVPPKNNGLRDSNLLIWLGIIASGLIQGISTYRGMGNPHWLPQNSDTPFHLNAVRFILNNENASSFFIYRLTGQVGTPAGFYPGAWHGVVSLSVLDSILLASNAMVLVVTAIIWTTSLAALGYVIAPHHKLVAALAPLVAAAYLSYPNRFYNAGVLWPQALAYAMVPAAVAVTILLFRKRAAHKRHLSWVLVLLTILGGIALAQPSGILVYAIFATPYIIARAFRPLWRHFRIWARSYSHRIRHTEAAKAESVVETTTGALPTITSSFALANLEAPPKQTVIRQLIRIILPLVAAAIWVYGWYRLFAFFSDQLENPTRTAGDQGFWIGVWHGLSDAAFFAGAFPRYPSLPIIIGTIFGVMVAFSHRHTRWLPFSLAGMLLLSGLVNADGFLSWLIYPWYADEQRLLATVPLVGAPLIALAIVALARGLARIPKARFPASPLATYPKITATVIALGLVAVFGLATDNFRFEERIRILNSNYVVTMQGLTTGNLVSEPEFELLQRMGRELPPGAWVIGDPLSGLGLAYAISNVNIIYTTLGPGHWGDDAVFLGREFENLPDDPEVCAALGRLGVQYFYNDTETHLHWRSAWERRFRGLWVSDQPWLEKIDSGGTATLYRITGCG
ncbi:MAG: hypothetical protein LBB58_01835 [Cellulomonadaceae bacterium]|jgi:hypothetical protein|nr:hypothetical protein [Cellulomonadaceae bacterium]